MKTKSLLTTLLAASCSLTAQAALLDLKTNSTVQYQSDAFSAAVGCSEADYLSRCSINLGITFLLEPMTQWSERGVRRPQLVSEFSQNSFTLQARHLSPDGRELQMIGEFQSQAVKNRMLVPSASPTFLMNFKLVSCENRPFKSEVIDYSVLSTEEIIANLSQIAPSDALFCDLEATRFDFAAPVIMGELWIPLTTLRVYQNGRVSVQVYPDMFAGEKFSQQAFALGTNWGAQAMGLELQHAKISATDARARALTAANEFSNLLKQYAEILVLSSQANSGVKDLAVEQFFKKNGKRIVTLKKNVEAEIGNLEIIDIFSILMPINQTYDYIKALEAKLKKEMTFDHSVRSYGN